jgi:hypothetical protein
MDEWYRVPEGFFQVEDSVRSELTKGIGQDPGEIQIHIPKKETGTAPRLRFTISLVPNYFVEIPISAREPIRQEIIIAAGVAARHFKENL